MATTPHTAGPTGNFPDGKIWPGDKGELAIGIGVDPVHKIIVLEFGILTKMIGMSPEQAIEIADDLIGKANELIEAKDREAKDKELNESRRL